MNEYQLDNARANAELLAHKTIESVRPHLIELFYAVLKHGTELSASSGSTSHRDALNDKDVLSTAEAAVVLNCSESHVRNLVEKARWNKTSVPIPYQDLDGVLRFSRTALIEWREKPKPRTAKPAKNKTRLAIATH